MLTTIYPILQAVSRKLKEDTTDTSTLRVGYTNDAIRYILGLYKWGWSIKKKDLTTISGVQEYDLTSEISDYSVIRGIYEIYSNEEKLDPVPYENKDSVSSNTLNYFYLKPDDKTLGFTASITGSENIDIYYYPEWTDVGGYTDTISVPIPESMVELIALYVKHLVHEGKRQRFDSRNALLDFKQALDTLIPQQGSAKIKDKPRRVYNFFSYLGFKRNYD
jgi:hypothetical protein